ncbi:hypothetical protein FHS57_001883 [Runella defluvii]|uniref:Uncharacterized protein n=1 Tax=Runella defluvii TaxID=370973 RepID=A0A7W6EQ03_9BACT|nr:DUF5682 family protein [Runella defluvii]MBB3837886.1 hypothetical protein [Runella defluvii]
MPLHILGIRHHGVGSAKNVVERLAQIQPDIILVEGPPELDSIVQWVGKSGLKPPVAVLGYNLDDLQQATFYPFAEFSPEWQAISYAHAQQLPVRMADLPMAISFQEQINLREVKKEQPVEEQAEEQEFLLPFKDPISYFADVAGYENSELWWEHHFEQKYIPNNAQEHFEAVLLMMSELRAAQVKSALDQENVAREAYMRELIRKAQNELYTNIVVVCGAWHAPALLDVETTAKQDAKLLKALPKTKIKVGCTWIPWTNDRLSMFSGYGAGITSPGWYEHLWKYGQNDDGSRWLTKVARLFRQKKMDISTAHVIEAFRLAETLASLRALSRVGLHELNEATQTVMCMGDGILLELVKKELIVAQRIGKVPDELPKLPLQENFEKLAKSYRLPITAEKKDYELDLRKETDLNRSKLIYRLAILDIKWGTQLAARTKGTFKEAWTLRWQPEMFIHLIEKGIWGNTVEDACTKFLVDKSQKTNDIKDLADLIQQAIPAELFGAIEQLLRKISEVATVSSDIIELMTALPPLVEVSRYGNVRKTDLSAINQLVEGLLTRICIGLPNACYGLDDENSRKVFDYIKSVNEATRLIENETLTQQWRSTLHLLLDKEGVNSLILGCTCRLLFDASELNEAQTAQRFELALSKGNDPIYSAGWVEGFLKGSGMILLYDNVLWNLLYRWVFELSEDYFIELLPILRRTFSKFEHSERKQLGEKAKKGANVEQTIVLEPTDTADFDHQRAEEVLPMLQLLLGLN